MATSAVVWTGCIRVLVTPDIRARRSDVALVFVGRADTCLTNGFVGWRESSSKGDDGRNYGDGKGLHDDGLNLGRDD